MSEFQHLVSIDFFYGPLGLLILRIYVVLTNISLILTWKQEIPKLWYEIGKTWVRTLNPLLCKPTAPSRSYKCMFWHTVDVRHAIYSFLKHRTFSALRSCEYSFTLKKWLGGGSGVISIPCTPCHLVCWISPVDFWTQVGSTPSLWSDLWGGMRGGGGNKHTIYSMSSILNLSRRFLNTSGQYSFTLKWLVGWGEGVGVRGEGEWGRGGLYGGSGRGNKHTIYSMSSILNLSRRFLNTSGQYSFTLKWLVGWGEGVGVRGEGEGEGGGLYGGKGGAISIPYTPCRLCWTSHVDFWTQAGSTPSPWSDLASLPYNVIRFNLYQLFHWRS